MKVGREEKLILEILSTEMYITSSELAEKTGYSSRTIRGKIREINEMLSKMSDCPMEIQAKPRFGFKLNIQEGTKQQILDQLFRENFREEDIPATPGDRANWLLAFCWIKRVRNDFGTGRSFVRDRQCRENCIEKYRKYIAAIWDSDFEKTGLWDLCGWRRIGSQRLPGRFVHGTKM